MKLEQIKIRKIQNAKDKSLKVNSLIISKMGLPKGRTNNVSGRPKGVPNKMGRDTKQLIHEFVQEKIKEMWQIWGHLTPREKALFLTNLLPFDVPKLQAVAVSGEVDFKTMSESDLDSIALKLFNYGKNKK